MKKILTMSLLIMAGYANAQIVLGANGNVEQVPSTKAAAQQQNNGIATKADAMNAKNGIVRGADANSNNSIAKGSEAKILRPNQPANDEVVISKKDYEADLKRRGLTQEQDLKRAKSLEVDNDGIIRSDIDFIVKPGGISVYDAQKLQIQKDLEEAKEASKIKGINSNSEYFDKYAKENLVKSQDLLGKLEKEMLYSKIGLIQYERVEKQIEMLNVIIDAKYSDAINNQANQLKGVAYNLLRQMFPFIWKEHLKGVEITSFSPYQKTLKVFNSSMNSSEVVKFKSLTEVAFSIGFEKIVYTNQKDYVIEEEVRQYIAKLKSEKQAKADKEKNIREKREVKVETKDVKKP